LDRLNMSNIARRAALRHGGINTFSGGAAAMEDLITQLEI
jgi:hypothetical protein